MANIKQNYGFKKISLDKLEDKETTLENVLEEFFKFKSNVREVVRKNEKEIVLKNVEKLENGDFLVVYELINYGNEKKIKNRNTLKEAGKLNPDQYLENFQFIYLSKKTSDFYNVLFHKTKSGIEYVFFFNLIWNFFENLKKDIVENLSDTMLRSFTYYSKDFFQRIGQMKELSTLDIEGSYSDVDLKFSGLETEEARFKCSIETRIKVRPEKGRFSFFEEKELKEFIQKQEATYGPLKIRMHGKDKNNSFKEVYSKEFEMQKSLFIKLYNNTEIDYNDLKRKMKSSVFSDLKDGYIEM